MATTTRNARGRGKSARKRSTASQRSSKRRAPKRRTRNAAPMATTTRAPRNAARKRLVISDDTPFTKFVIGPAAGSILGVVGAQTLGRQGLVTPAALWGGMSAAGIFVASKFRDNLPLMLGATAFSGLALGNFAEIIRRQGFRNAFTRNALPSAIDADDDITPRVQRAFERARAELELQDAIADELEQDELELAGA